MKRWFAILLLLPSSVFAKPDFKLGGRINLELDSRDRFAGLDLDKEAILDVKTRREQGFLGAIDARISSDAGTFSLREVYIEYENQNEDAFRVGQDRKRFGLDWEYSMSERLTLIRAPIYTKLARLTYVGRDTLLRFRTAKKEEPGLNHDFSIHTANGFNVAFLYGLKHWFSRKTFFGSYTLAQASRVDRVWVRSGGQAFVFSKRDTPVSLDAELFIGEDYLETAFNRQLGTDREVWFSSFHLGTAVKLAQWEPFARGSVILNDLSVVSNHTLELSLGLRYFFIEDLYLGGQLQILHSQFLHEAAFDSGSMAMVALRYFF